MAACHRYLPVWRLRANRGCASHFARLTVTVNDALAVFALESVAAHVTRVLPSGKRLQDLELHPAGTTTSVSSWAVTLKVTRALFAPFFARTVLLVAPASVGAVTLNSSPGTVRVPVQVSVPADPVSVEPRERVTTPVPDAPA